MSDEKISRRGVYYDLTQSPYEYTNPYGDLFKFSSQKKLDIYRRDIISDINRIEKAMTRTGVIGWLPDEILVMIYRYVYRALYARVEK